MTATVRPTGFAPRIAIVGGGIAGLATAHAVRGLAPDAEVIVLEARDRIGGHLHSERVDGYLCEAGPDGFLDNAPATLAFVEAIGLSPRLQASRDEARRRFIFRRGRLHDVPLSPLGFATTGLLSAGAKLRVLAEPFAVSPPRRDESILAFAERHVGREAARVLVGSMVSGVFAGDAAELSLQSCFPKMHEMELQYGSLFRALLAKRRSGSAKNGVGAPAGRLTSFSGGMEDLARAAAAAMGPSVRTGCGVTAIDVRHPSGTALRPVGGRAYSLICNGRRIEADALVLAGAAAESAALVRPFAPIAAVLLAALPTAPLAVVCLGYDAAALAADRGPLNGFGFLVPRGEGPRLLGALWETSIYDDRAPLGKSLLRVMIGGAADPGAVQLDDGPLIARVRADLEQTMGLRIAPEFVHVVRHWRGIPQYTVGHAARLARIEAGLAGHPGLFLAGNAYRGVSVNACIEDARQVAARVASHLGSVQQREEYAHVR
jgi:oxygen-dependent protoporphyrinogen oxidase